MPQRSADRKKEVAAAGGRGMAAGEGRKGKDQKGEGRLEKLKSSRLKSQFAKVSQRSGNVHIGGKHVVSQS